MKKRLISLVLAMVMLFALCVTVGAANEPSITVFDSGTTVVFSPGSVESFDITATVPSEGEYLILVLKATLNEDGSVNGDPTESIATDDILYINQVTVGSDKKAAFTAENDNPVYPKKVADCAVYLVGSEMDKTLLATIKAGYRLGDTNIDDTVDFTDAILVLQYEAGITMAVDFCEAAADVTGEGDIDFTDAIRILQHEAGLYTIPGWEE